MIALCFQKRIVSLFYVILPTARMKSLCPEGLLGSRQFFDSVQLQSWCLQKFHEVATLPVGGQQRNITVSAAEQLNFLPWVAERNCARPQWWREEEVPGIRI